jgi:hypothetical protein
MRMPSSSSACRDAVADCHPRATTSDTRWAHGTGATEGGEEVGVRPGTPAPAPTGPSDPAGVTDHGWEEKEEEEEEDRARVAEAALEGSAEARDRVANARCMACGVF